MSENNTALLPANSQNVSVPYIGFRGAKSERNLDALEAAGVKANDFYIFDGLPIRVSPLEVHILNFARFWVQEDEDTGNVLDVVTSWPGKDSGYRERVFAAVIAVLPGGGLTAATLRLNGAQCGALRDTLKLLGPGGRAATPESWAACGPKFAESAGGANTPPGFRFSVSIKSEPKPIPGTKYSCNNGVGSVSPSSPARLAALKAYADSDKNVIAAALHINQLRVQEIFDATTEPTVAE